MKRSLVVVQFVLLIILGSCTPAPLPQFTDPQWTAIAATQQLMGQTHEEKIKAWLNAPLYSYDKFNALEQSLVGKYEVINVWFPSPYHFQVEMNCECASGSSCCDPEQMFVLTMQEMARFRDQIVTEVPVSVQNMNLVCYDHNRPFAVMYASWDNIKKFLYDQITGFDLGSSVIRRNMP